LVSEKEKDKQESIYLAKIKQFQHHLGRLHPKNKIEKLGYFDLINKSISLLTYHIAELSIEKYPPDILIQVSHDTCGIFDFYKAEELVEIGRLSAKERIDDYCQE
jgi:NTE family protein